MTEKVSAIDVKNYVIDYVRNELVGANNLKNVNKLNKYAGFPAVQIDGNEILKDHERPLEKYAAGILFPMKSTMESVGTVQLREEQGNNSLNDEVDNNVNTEMKILGNRIETDSNDVIDQSVSLTNEFLPSAIGMSFLADTTNGLTVKFSTGIYEHKKNFIRFSDSKELQSAWFRSEITEEIYLTREQLFDTNNKILKIPVKNKDNNEVGLEVYIVSRPYKKSSTNKRMMTISLINRKVSKSNSPSDENCFFQAQLFINTKTEKGILSYPKNLELMDNEQLNLQLLYRNKSSFGIGHGCAVKWSSTEEDSTDSIWTEIIPTFEIKPIEPTLIDDADLTMRKLAHEQDNFIFSSCNAMIEKYSKWISLQQKELETSDLDSRLKEIAWKNIEKAKICASRMASGIRLMQEDGNVLQAFKWMNESMYLQHEHYSISINKKREWVYRDFELRLDTQYEEPANYDHSNRSWRPFQLGFILMNLLSMNDPDSSERDIVDLIWFPTGGGKTEAYLGLTAFTLFLRRIKNPSNAGTTVLMRYTLRLLTTQQFQRASSMICACELIRRKNNVILGNDRFSVGLWVGGDVSPNTEDEAKRLIGELEQNKTSQNKFIVTSCPWCGAEMGPVKKGNRAVCKGYKITGNRRGQTPKTRFECEDPDCRFTAKDGGLPLAVIDEHIYDEPPSLLFSTVDKFAQLPFQIRAKSLFSGTNSSMTPPELIIQDELHLISGPLGSMVGHYETVIDALCRELHPNKQKPKIVASTATISRADEQILSLYAREGFLFPPQVLKAGDSFFAEETNNPGREYIGVMNTAVNSHATSQVRTIGALIQSIMMLDDVDQHHIDPYWTLVGYFNSLRELGHAATMVSADIREYLNVIWSNRGLKVFDTENNQHQYRRFINRYLELTSRMSSSDIPISLQELFTESEKDEKHSKNKKNKAIDICFATNMIQVGLDVPRLSLMTIIGQPKTTSEYIQASSRVGREMSKPGLVVTNFNPAKPRDRSHYEDFTSYHQTIYKFVEPTSVTPFSIPVRERALAALIVILTRYLYPEYSERPNPAPSIEVQHKIKKLILERIKTVDEDEYNSAEKMIDSFYYYWGVTEPSRYGGYKILDEPPLVYPAGTEKGKCWHRAKDIPSSMRSVDRTCEAYIYYPSHEDAE